MAIGKSTIVNVLNYNENPVCIKTHLREYICPKCTDGKPSITPLEFSEIEYLSSSQAFQTGTLFFEEEMQKEVYEALRILDWEKILRNEDIEEILLKPSLEGLKKIIEIKNVMLFERVRGIYFSLKNTNQYDLSTRVERIVNTRYNELCNRQLKTKIILTEKDTSVAIPNSDMDNLKKQNESLQAQMFEMQKVMEQMISMQNANVDAPESAKEKSEDADKDKPSARKAGRPKKS